MARRKRTASSANQLFDHARARSHGAERDQHLHRIGLTADGGKTRRAWVADALDASGMTVCAVCSRETRGFYYTHLLYPDRYPTFAFCSMRCLKAGTVIAKRNQG